MKGKTKTLVKATKVSLSAKSITKKSTARKEPRDVIEKRKPTRKITQSKSGSQMRKCAKNFSFKNPAGKEKKQNNNSTIKCVAWALDAPADASYNTNGSNIDDNMKEDISDIADHYKGRKRSLKRTAVSKIGSEGQRGKEGASVGLGHKVDTMKGAPNSRVSAPSKGKSTSVKKGGRARKKNFGKIEESEENITRKASPKKRGKFAVPTVGAKKKRVMNGGGGASGGRVKQKDSADVDIGRKIKQGSGVINTEIIGKTDGQTTTESIASRLRTRKPDANGSPSGISTNLRQGLQGVIKSARRKKAKQIQ
ncbi:hypothetical protein LOAG_03204 [Loa loa]|uniref:Uncharacterized protein n=1 Tax=Loa loa TaxID=7209 RepID=A0A1S0U4P3_LOALO|nr:hypothetical protein LOAG_03204 [Loa loa]EFO25277.1 hypothetical protein LOAG_03204 [Loa loa]